LFTSGSIWLQLQIMVTKERAREIERERKEREILTEKIAREGEKKACSLNTKQAQRLARS